MANYIIAYSGSFMMYNEYPDALTAAKVIKENTGFNDRPLVIYKVEPVFCINPGKIISPPGEQPDDPKDIA